MASAFGEPRKLQNAQRFTLVYELQIRYNGKTYRLLVLALEFIENTFHENDA